MKLGDKVKDITTGFAGIVVARTEHLNNSPQLGIQSQELFEGRPAELAWADEPNCILVESAAVAALMSKAITAVMAEDAQSAAAKE